MSNKPVTTTLNKIREHNPCEDGWKKLLKHLGKTKSDDEEFPMLEILDSNGLDDCLWALRTRPDLSSLWRLYAVDAAREVEHLVEDQHSKDALDVAECHALGKATDEELAAAWGAAKVAEDASWAAARAAEDAAWGAGSAARAAAREKQSAMLRRMLESGERPNWKDYDNE